MNIQLSIRRRTSCYGATRCCAQLEGASNMPFCETNRILIWLEIDVSMAFARCYALTGQAEESGSFGKQSRFDGSGPMFLTWYQGVAGIRMVRSVILYTYEGRRVGGRGLQRRCARRRNTLRTAHATPGFLDRWQAGRLPYNCGGIGA